MISTAFVHIWGKRAGAIAWNEISGTGSFEYDQRFRKLGWELSPLKMPVRSATPVFTFPELRRPALPGHDTFRGIPGLLADTLPDRYGNQLINAWLARRGRPPGSMNPVEMLCFIGTRGVGALEFEPAHFPGEEETFSVEVSELVETAKKLLNDRTEFKGRLTGKNEKTIRDLLRLGTSAGGARPKAVITYNSSTGDVQSGQAGTAAGFSQWIIKLDGVSDIQLGSSTGYGRVEMAYYSMATACGIQMTECRLLEENGRAHFMTRRFDREDDGSKHHIQSLCALKHFDYNDVYSYSYEQLFQTMRELRLSYPEFDQMFRRMVFNILARNCDDHSKNFAFRLKQGERWELAPAYDVCHAYRPGSAWVSQHALSVNGKRKDITLNDLLKVAASVGVKKPLQIIEEVMESVSRWKKWADSSGVDQDLRKAVAKTHVNLK